VTFLLFLFYHPVVKIVSMAPRAVLGGSFLPASLFTPLRRGEKGDTFFLQIRTTKRSNITNHNILCCFHHGSKKQYSTLGLPSRVIFIPLILFRHSLRSCRKKISGMKNPPCCPRVEITISRGAYPLYDRISFLF
jgi:hypothetical protein